MHRSSLPIPVCQLTNLVPEISCHHFHAGHHFYAPIGEIDRVRSTPIFRGEKLPNQTRQRKLSRRERGGEKERIASTWDRDSQDGLDSWGNPK